jgi:uncharacterized integral membrane protein
MAEKMESEESSASASRLFQGLGKVKAKTWGYLLLAVVIIVFLAQNSVPPVRIQFLLFRPFGVPFSVSAIFFFAIGFLVCHLRRRGLKE